MTVGSFFFVFKDFVLLLRYKCPKNLLKCLGSGLSCRVDRDTTTQLFVIFFAGGGGPYSISMTCKFEA